MGHLSTGLIVCLNFQEDLKPTSALTPQKSSPGSHLHDSLRAQLGLPGEACSGGRSSTSEEKTCSLANPGRRVPNPSPWPGCVQEL